MRVLAIVLVVAASLPMAAAQNLAVVDATVYAAPDAPALRHATVLVMDGKIAAVGAGVQVPKGTQVLPCKDCAVFAGFWNCHVHFTGVQWLGAGRQPAGALTQEMQRMVTRSGFTTVMDAASDPENTIALRRRVESGEVPGPHIYTAGSGLYPPHAIPYYLSDLPQAVRDRLPQPDDPRVAAGIVEQQIAMGTDLVKLFTGSYVAPDRVVAMPVEIARAAVEAGHRHHQLVYAHPSNLQGVRVAIESGVDVLAHAPDTVEGVDESLLRQIVARKMAMIPTLKLFSGEQSIARIRQIVAQFHALGGQLLFGTDTGYLTDYSVDEEYRQLALAGLGFREVLAMLTTAPAERFGRSAREGQIRPGFNGDLTILGSDPAEGKLERFTDARYAVRGGRVIFAAGAR